MKYGKNQPL